MAWFEEILDRVDFDGVRMLLQISPFTQLGESRLYLHVFQCFFNARLSNGLENVLGAQAEYKSFFRLHEQPHDRSVERRLLRSDVCESVDSPRGLGRSGVRQRTHLGHL